jgi:hypothetical protein
MGCRRAVDCVAESTTGRRFGDDGELLAAPSLSNRRDWAIDAPWIDQFVRLASGSFPENQARAPLLYAH